MSKLLKINKYMKIVYLLKKKTFNTKKNMHIQVYILFLFKNKNLCNFHSSQKKSQQTISLLTIFVSKRELQKF